VLSFSLLLRLKYDGIMTVSSWCWEIWTGKSLW